MKRTRVAAAAALLLLPPLIGGCGRGEEPAASPSEDAAMDGLSPDQIRQQAESMSPERAAELGIVDTTIHVEKLTSPEDSALFTDPSPPPPRDTIS